MVNNIEKPTARKEDEAVRPKARVVGLLSFFGFTASASAAGIFADSSLSDIATVAATRGLAIGGLAAAVAGAVIIFRQQVSKAARAKALKEVRQDFDDLVQAEKARQDIDPRVQTEVISKLVELGERLDEKDRHSARMGWFQGAVYAALGAAVAVLLIVFSRWIPVIK
jgi:hypothetical protein